MQVRFLDAILSQNNTDDHMQEFIKQEGLEPMIKLLALTPLAAESTYATANTAIIDTCRNILVSLYTMSYIYPGFHSRPLNFSFTPWNVGS